MILLDFWLHFQSCGFWRPKTHKPLMEDKHISKIRKEATTEIIPLTDVADDEAEL